MKKTLVGKMNQYLIIKCGYEGIEGLVFLTENPIEAKNKIISIRKEVEKFRSQMEIVGDEKWGDMFVNGEISNESYDLSNDKPDQYCVQKWDGKQFSCCCQELGVEPNEVWLM